MTILAKLVLIWMVGLQDPTLTTWGDTYVETAQAIADACEARPVFGSPVRCAATLTAIGFHEGRFSPDRVGDGAARGRSTSTPGSLG